MLYFGIGRILGCLVFTLLAATLWGRAFKGMPGGVRRQLAIHGASFWTLLPIFALSDLNGRPMSELAASAVFVGLPLMFAQALWFVVGVYRDRKA